MHQHSIARVYNLALCARLALCGALCAGPLTLAAAVPAHDQAGSGKQAAVTQHKRIFTHKRIARPSPATAAAKPVSAAPAAPAAPDWPVNDKPTDARVVWDSRGLTVDANNSSLRQILMDVCTDTGARMEGPAPSDVRVFGTYGPAPASEVISQLINGTGYNVLIIGQQGSDAPRQIVLSAAPTGPAPQNNARSEDEYVPEPPEPISNGIVSSPMNNGFVPQPRSAQQMEEMQLRQEQIQQELREQMMNQQQTPETNPTPPQLGK